MQKYYDAAGVTMPEQKALDATVSMADSSKRSADAAERSASSARWSMLWAFIAAIVAIASLIWQMLTSR